MTDALVQIIVALIGLLGVIITRAVVPWINANTTEKQRATVDYWVKVAVVAFEIYFQGHNMGPLRKEAVIDFIMEQEYPITEDQLSILIDAVVKQVINNDKVS